MMEYMLMPLKRYADFSGRSGRREYWMFMLGWVLLAAVTFALTVIATPVLGTGARTVIGFVFILVMLALIIPSLAVRIRRFHDQDRSGWFFLFNFIPYIGGVIVVVFMLQPGTKGQNRFGEDPYASDNLAEVFS